MHMVAAFPFDNPDEPCRSTTTRLCCVFMIVAATGF